MSIFGPDNVDGFIISDDLDMDRNRIIDLRNPQDALDAVNKKYLNKRIEFKTRDLENKLTTLEIKVAAFDGTEPFTSDLNMGNNRIINVAHPRNPTENSEHEHDVVTAKYLYDYLKLKIADNEKYLKANKDNVLNGRLNMQQHKITNLADPVESYDAVNLHYVSSRIQALADENTIQSSSISRLSKHVDDNWKLVMTQLGVGSMFIFHVYYQIRRILKEINAALPQDPSRNAFDNSYN